MKVNSLISEIIRGEWLLDIRNIESYFPMVDKILAGQPLNLPQSTKSIFNIIDASGNSLKANENGVVNVPEGSIAIVSMIGEIVKYGDACIYGADEIVAALTKAQNMKNVVATIFKIDGPGGAVSAVGPFMEFAQTEKKHPIIGLCDNALSAHYWIAAETCDYIMAENTVSSRFGSIGVMLSFADNKKALEEKGYTIHEIYPPESSYKNQAFILAREGKYEMIKSEFLSPMAKKFQESVRAKRPNIKEEAGVLNGKVFFAEEALRLNMIDGIGGMQKAIRQAIAMSSIQLFNN